MIYYSLDTVAYRSGAKVSAVNLITGMLGTRSKSSFISVALFNHQTRVGYAWRNQRPPIFSSRWQHLQPHLCKHQLRVWGNKMWKVAAFSAGAAPQLCHRASHWHILAKRNRYFAVHDTSSVVCCCTEVLEARRLIASHGDAIRGSRYMCLRCMQMHTCAECSRINNTKVARASDSRSFEAGDLLS